ncbi:alpha/beta hydrolase [Anaerobacillus alkaliphilus]|uniref:Alpha/beta hydrolase n=1 Tax=Anaerobacillus alkaliphilus TaxID=1548597 RepID=A0A4Q0VX76_9BACI|nr:alpha/beta hydrolase [Anaerobacillus alkaliphilus]RXJ04343.1 alpha/beta hydrolase [Anaerobacillus alkaliphilus]
MIYEKIDITFEQETASLVTYILDNSPSIDAERKRPMVVICPGGGYRHTSDREAEPIAIKLNAMGFHACVLRYSVKPAVFPTALCQLAKVIGLIREKAEDWNIDTTKVFVMGFSAGGHLAASLGVFWNQEFLTEKLGLPSEQIRPNGMILCYPVITSGEHANQGSFQSLLGDKAYGEDLLSQLSLENQITKNTPPTFLWHTVEDTAVPVENSLLFANSLLKNKVPLELHIYPRGVHGLSLGTGETKAKDNEKSVQPEVANWITMAGRWIEYL